jgi:hypothetical protein
MLTKFVIAFSILALVAAFAGTAPAVAHVTLARPALLSGTALPAGDYRVLIGDGKVTFSIDRKSFDIPAKIETATKKFEITEVAYDDSNSKTSVKEISLGGTKTRLIFN